MERDTVTVGDLGSRWCITTLTSPVCGRVGGEPAVMTALLKLGESLVEDCGVLGGGDVFSDLSVGCGPWEGRDTCRKDSDKVGCYVHFCRLFGD